jgi:hypothetical protein
MDSDKFIVEGHWGHTFALVATTDYNHDLASRRMPVRHGRKLAFRQPASDHRPLLDLGLNKPLQAPRCTQKPQGAGSNFRMI